MGKVKFKNDPFRHLQVCFHGSDTPRVRLFPILSAPLIVELVQPS